MAGDGQNSAEFCPMGHPVRDNPHPISAMKKLYGVLCFALSACTQMKKSKLC